jgi:hypothetical protein
MWVWADAWGHGPPPPAVGSAALATRLLLCVRCSARILRVHLPVGMRFSRLSLACVPLGVSLRCWYQPVTVSGGRIEAAKSFLAVEATSLSSGVDIAGPLPRAGDPFITPRFAAGGRRVSDSGALWPVCASDRVPPARRLDAARIWGHIGHRWRCAVLPAVGREGDAGAGADAVWEAGWVGARRPPLFPVVPLLPSPEPATPCPPPPAEVPTPVPRVPPRVLLFFFRGATAPVEVMAARLDALHRHSASEGAVTERGAPRVSTTDDLEPPLTPLVYMPGTHSLSPLRPSKPLGSPSKRGPGAVPFGSESVASGKRAPAAEVRECACAARGPPTVRTAGGI